MNILARGSRTWLVLACLLTAIGVAAAVHFRSGSAKTTAYITAPVTVSDLREECASAAER
ncbi:hypothetical protein BRDID11002_11080 [Bradyrhizobium diazoefficiens]